MTALTVGLAAALAAGGALILGLAAWRTPTAERDHRIPRALASLAAGPAGWSWRLPLGALVGAAVGGATGWPAAGLWSAALVAWLPSLARRGRERRATVARVEAVARWAEMLRDQVLVGADLAQAVRGSARVAPAPIAPAVQALDARLAVMEPAEALAAFAAEVDDPMAELLAAGLRFSLTRRTAKLADLFAEVARTTREQASMRRGIEAERRRLRTVVWGALSAVTAWLVLIYLLSGAYLAPYDTGRGQAVMFLAGAAFAGGLAALSKMDRIGAPVRLHLREVRGP